MCGIYGYIGNGNAYKIVKEGLSLLQYRGYDSCGIAYKTNGGYKINKAVGPLDNLEDINEQTNTAFGHTRWATNGKVTIDNAHPHVSNNGKVILVHNGIVKNAENIKNRLLEHGYSFYSETDTEIVANYIEYIGIDNLTKLFDDLIGTFALIVEHEDDIYLIKKFNPINILTNQEGIYISSDISSLPTGKLHKLKDNEIIKITNRDIKSLSSDYIDWCTHENKKEELNLDNFNHYMIKEIFATPEAILNTYNKIKDIDIRKIFKGIKKITLLGCGTAYNSCLIGEELLSELGFDSRTYLASNYVIDREVISEHLHLIVSQSGETADCIKVAEQVRSKGGRILLITNEINSTLAQLADDIIPSNAKKELAVASTKTYCCQVFVFDYICSLLDENREKANVFEQVNMLKSYLDNLELDEIVNKIKDSKNMILIGKGIDYLTLIEAALKIREIDYVYTIPMYASELKHGTLSLVDSEATILTLDTTNNDELKTAINEIESRGGSIIKMEKFLFGYDIDKYFRPIFSIIAFQLLSYYVAVSKGGNPDMPRNLAKSVTVE